VDNSKELRCVSFCAGYGGIERGIELAGAPIRTVAHVEIEAYAIANMVAKMEAGQMVPAPVWSNLKTFPMEKFCGCVDILTGGFPCQPFSSAGSRGADEDPRHLFPYFKRFLERVRPRYVFLENVAGIASAKLSGSSWTDPAGTSVLLHVLRELERVGYRAKAGLFTAEETSAPHRRERWFIYGELANTSYNDDRGNPGVVSSAETAERVRQSDEGERSANASKSPEKLADLSSEGLEGSTGSRIQGTSEGPASHGGNEKLGDTQKLFRDGSASELGGKSVGQAVSELGNTNWPAPPGPEQYEWEEPRVVADSKNLGRGGRTDSAHGDDQRGVQKQESEVKSVVWSEAAGCCGNDGGGELADATSEQARGVRESESQPNASSNGGGDSTGNGLQRESEYPPKPQLGRTAHGNSCGVDTTANRVDRLRMCGNGVVPQTAAVAWSVLHV